MEYMLLVMSMIHRISETVLSTGIYAWLFGSITKVFGNSMGEYPCQWYTHRPCTEENLGESEVCEAHLVKSLFFIRIMDKEKALEHLKVTKTKIVVVGQKMDLVFYTLQLGFFDMDFDLISKSIDKAKKKNRLEVYEGLYFMSTRNFKKAAKLFLGSISTFTTYEVFPCDTFILYTVLTIIISLDRVSLKQKVVDSPKILTMIGKIPYLSEFLNSLYDCQYKSFFLSIW
ncbi:hypothetical protein JHK84_047847 [Glycine max]|nr:hypothetical protein JHK86_047825 [Glycine max]KAG4933621.1 hypothetical protein JHK87_047623 [Glycine soja]KAG4943794.1 hypothetical protein JHK85_048440 [Glycine max]KAG5102878.1 hypothetical protein JHK84_047847 [Glycine max]KAH1202881.1 26S proteasome non-ATPase regulatory subunit 6 [Glycine max]